MSKMYVWFLQKTKANSPKGPSTLAKAIAELLNCTKLENNLIVAPGFLSQNSKTIKSFYKGFDSLLNHGEQKHIDVGFLRGMGSYDAFHALLDMHKEELEGNAHIMRYFPAFDLSKANKDHRKMVFLYSSKETACQNLNKEINRRGLTSQNARTLVNDITVNAVVIGSSNFSKRTYFDPFDKGEADVILLSHSTASTASDFTDIIEGFTAANSENRNNTSSITTASISNRFPDSVFAESVFCGNSDPHQYLKDILLETIEQTL